MASIIDQVIESFRKLNDGKDDEVITALLEAKAALGDNATEEEVHEAIERILDARIRALIGDDADHQAYMDSATATVREFLEDNDWHFRTNTIRPDLVRFELGFNVKGCQLTAHIHIEANPHLCHIDAILPIKADPMYEYPLCAAIAKENYRRNIGSLKYDARDGELKYEYVYPIGHGFYKEDLDRLFHTVISNAVDSYNNIRRCSVGKFKSKETNEILRKADALIQDLTDE